MCIFVFYRFGLEHHIFVLVSRIIVAVWWWSLTGFWFILWYSFYMISICFLFHLIVIFTSYLMCNVRRSFHCVLICLVCFRINFSAFVLMLSWDIYRTCFYFCNSLYTSALVLNVLNLLNWDYYFDSVSHVMTTPLTRF